MLIFTVAGFGMALPYVLLAAHPAWLRFSSTADSVPVTLTVGVNVAVDFGDWDGLPTWLPLIVAK